MSYCDLCDLVAHEVFLQDGSNLLDFTLLRRKLHEQLAGNPLSDHFVQSQVDKKCPRISLVSIAVTFCANESLEFWTQVMTKPEEVTHFRIVVAAKR